MNEYFRHSGEPEFLTIEELAARVRVHHNTIRRWIKRAHDPLPHIRAGRQLRFRWADVSAWLDRQTDERREAA